MIAAEKIKELLGGEVVTGRLVTELDLVGLVRRGLPPVAVDNFLAATRQPFSLIEAYVMSERALARRRAAGLLLSKAESDRMLRIVRLVAAAENTIGDRDRALNWLQRPNRALEWQAPIAMADTNFGAREVEHLLGRVAHGLAA